MAVLFHSAVSGYPFEAPAYRYVDAGPNWATGGIWGPEASVPAGLSMLLVVGYLDDAATTPTGELRWPSG